MTKKRILVCGAGGFIGQNVFEALSRWNDYDVMGTYRNPDHRRRFTAQDKQRSILRLVDLTSREEIMDAVHRADVVIQCAAVTSGAQDIVTQPDIHVTDNVIINALLLEAAFKHRTPHFIFLSCTVMYPMNLDHPVREYEVDRGKIYEKYRSGARMKLFVEELCEDYARWGDTKFTIVRHSNVYGHHDKFDLERSHMVGATITKVMQAAEGAAISVWGDGTEGRDLLYVSDLVDFIGLAIEKQETPYEIVNVGAGVSVPVRDVVTTIVTQSGKNLSIEYDLSKPTLPVTVSLDCTKAKEQFGWLPKVDLPEGIRRTIEWYKENIHKKG